MEDGIGDVVAAGLGLPQVVLMLHLEVCYS